jgi:hypothetical protein
VLFAVAVGVLVAGPAFAEPASKTGETAAKPADKAGAPADMPAPPKPGPEHQVLKGSVGTWDATIEHFMPGQEAHTAKGVETAKLVGGLWLVSDFKGDMMGAPFEGHAVAGYDSNKKKYVGTWIDTMSVGKYDTEGTYDAATKTMTERIEGPGMDGKPAKWKAVTEWKDADTRVFSMYDDGKESPSMRITYKRKN